MRPRLGIYLIITAVLLAAGAWVGGGDLLLGADRVHAVPVIGGVLFVAVGFGWAGRWESVEWIGEKLPVLGLMGTVLGVLLAIQDVTTVDDATRLRIFTGVGQSLVANLLGVAGYAWLALARRVCDR
jgi:hypothetical protein